MTRVFAFHQIKSKLCSANRTEEFHLFLNCSLDSFEAGSENLSGVEALAYEILAFFDVLSCLSVYLMRNACQRGKRIKNQQCDGIHYYQKLDYLRL